MASWYELADKQSVDRNADGTITASKMYRINGEPTANPPEGAGNLPQRGDSHPVYSSIKVQSLSFKPVPCAGWDCEVSYAAREIEVFQQIPTNIGQYRYGLTHSEIVVQMPVARKTFKWFDNPNSEPTALTYYEIIGLEIPTGSMTFTAEVIEWAPSWQDIETIRKERGKIHQFGGPQGPLFRFMGAETQYLGMRGVGSDPVFRNVVRYHYQWVGDDGTTIDDPRSDELITPYEIISAGPAGPVGPIRSRRDLHREPFTQWVVIPSTSNMEPPSFDLARPYKLDDFALRRGWTSLPGARYWIDLE